MKQPLSTKTEKNSLILVTMQKILVSLQSGIFLPTLTAKEYVMESERVCKDWPAVQAFSVLIVIR